MSMIRLWLLFAGFSLALSCSRIYPPVAFVDRVAPIYPDARPKNCNVTVLNGEPTQPFEIFAQVTSYAGSAEMAEGMETVIKSNACEIGADAIVLLPMQERFHVDTIDTYPGWVLDSGFGQGGRFAHWVDKRYHVSQKAIALIYKREAANKLQEPGS